MTGAVVGISYLWMMLTPLEETIPTSRALLALRPFVLREPVGLVELPRDRLDESFSEWASRWRAEPEILNVEQGSRDYIRLSYRVNLTEEFMRTGHALFAVMLGTLAAGLIAFVGTGRERRVKPGRARSPEAPG